MGKQGPGAARGASKRRKRRLESPGRPNSARIQDRMVRQPPPGPAPPPPSASPEGDLESHLPNQALRNRVLLCTLCTLHGDLCSRARDLAGIDVCHRRVTSHTPFLPRLTQGKK